MDGMQTRARDAFCSIASSILCVVLQIMFQVNHALEASLEPVANPRM